MTVQYAFKVCEMNRQSILICGVLIIIAGVRSETFSSLSECEKEITHPRVAPLDLLNKYARDKIDSIKECRVDASYNFTLYVQKLQGWAMDILTKKLDVVEYAGSKFCFIDLEDDDKNITRTTLLHNRDFPIPSTVFYDHPDVRKCRYADHEPAFTVIYIDRKIAILNKYSLTKCDCNGDNGNYTIACSGGQLLPAEVTESPVKMVSKKKQKSKKDNEPISS